MTGSLQIHAQEDSKTVFIVTGELSGDRLGAWYLQHLKKEHKSIRCHAIGGDYLKEEGAILHKHFNELTIGIAGLFNLIGKLPSVVRTFRELSHYLLAHDFDEIVLVDFPLLNIPLAWYLQRYKKDCRITYVAPPELWFWGSWGIDGVLKSSCDEIVVLYPFEKTWYQQKNLPVKWHGYPLYDDLIKKQSTRKKEHIIALLPGSRRVELDILLPIYAKVVSTFKAKHPEVRFILPLARSIPIDSMNMRLASLGIEDAIEIIVDEAEKYELLQRSCLALTKPGTVTLELAFLKVPSVIVYKVPLLTYWFSKLIIQVPYVGLPNLLLGKEVQPELLQNKCTPTNILDTLENLYESFSTNGTQYQEMLSALDDIQDIMKDERDFQFS